MEDLFHGRSDVDDGAARFDVLGALAAVGRLGFLNWFSEDSGGFAIFCRFFIANSTWT